MSISFAHPRLAVGRFNSYRFLILLLAMLLLLTGSAFVGRELLDRAILGILFLIVLLAAVGAAAQRPRERLLALVLAASNGVVIGGGLMLQHRGIYLPGLALQTLYLAYTIHVVLRRIVTARQIDADILCGAAAIYLLVGVAWSVTFWMIYEIDHTAFSANPAQNLPPYTFHDFTYYSLSCLTSLGMGDITPINRFAQIWSTIETVAGNLYLAVLVSRLVSLYR